MSGSYPTPWKTNVLGVLGEYEYCFPSILCPAFAYYSISESFEIPPAGVLESCAGGYNLDGSYIGDFLAHLTCHCVALARIWREAEIQGRIEFEAKRQQSQQPPPHLQAPPFQSFAPHVPPGPVHPQPYVTVGGAIGLGYYDPSFTPQPVHQPTRGAYIQDQGNTVDTSLSGFEGDQGVAESTSYFREDSLDPPPSNTDTNPWDMLQGGTEREDPAPIVLPVMRRQETRTSAAVIQGISSTRQTFRGDPLPQMVSQLEDQNTPTKPTEIELNASSKQVQKEVLMNKSSANLNSRLANLRPPKAAPLPAMTEEDSEAADRIILEHDSMLTMQEVEDDLLDPNPAKDLPSPQQSKD